MLNIFLDANVIFRRCHAIQMRPKDKGRLHSNKKHKGFYRCKNQHENPTRFSHGDHRRRIKKLASKQIPYSQNNKAPSLVWAWDAGRAGLLPAQSPRTPHLCKKYPPENGEKTRLSPIKEIEFWLKSDWNQIAPQPPRTYILRRRRRIRNMIIII